MRMRDEDNNGRIFERCFYNSLRNIYGIDYIYDELQLRKTYGWPSVGVDYLIIKGDNVIAIQVKYRRTRRREDHGIMNYMKSLEYVLRVTNKKLVKGFWISRMKPFDDNIAFLNSKNVHCIHHYDDMNVLIEKAMNTLQTVF